MMFRLFRTDKPADNTAVLDIHAWVRGAFRVCLYNL